MASTAITLARNDSRSRPGVGNVASDAKTFLAAWIEPARNSTDDSRQNARVSAQPTPGARPGTRRRRKLGQAPHHEMLAGLVPQAA